MVNIDNNDELTTRNGEENYNEIIYKALSDNLKSFDNKIIIKNICDSLQIFSKISDEIVSNLNIKSFDDLFKKIISYDVFYKKQIKILSNNYKDNRTNWVASIYSSVLKTYQELEKFSNNYKCNLEFNLIGILARDTGYLLREKSINIDESYEKSITVKINLLGQKICSLLSNINSIENNMNKITPKTFSNVAIIAGNIADNEDIFCKIVNACYELLYEGFGKDNLRTKKYIEFDDYPALYDIKNLRLKYNHDIEHGSENEINNKKQKINLIFIKFIKKLIPVSSKDFKNCQLKLYKEIVEWLEAILTKINCISDK